MLFQIPTGSGQGYLKSGSAYLKCTVTVTQTGGATNYWAFSNGLNPNGAVAITTGLTLFIIHTWYHDRNTKSSGFLYSIISCITKLLTATFENCRIR